MSEGAVREIMAKDGVEYDELSKRYWVNVGGQRRDAPSSVPVSNSCASDTLRHEDGEQHASGRLMPGGDAIDMLDRSGIVFGARRCL